MKSHLIYKERKFLALGNAALVLEKMDQEEFKKSGWKHNNLDGYFTTDLMSASLLRDFANDRAKNILTNAFIQYTPWKDALHIPDGLKALPHQPSSAAYSLSRNRSYLALAPGLGKTIVAALIAASVDGRVLVIVPPFLALNTLEEFNKWAPKKFTKILDNVDYIVPDILIAPDSQLSNKSIKDYIKFFKPKIITIDEAHRFKNDMAVRTNVLLGHKQHGEYVPGLVDVKGLKHLIYMSGTPMPNRPMELFGILKKSAGQYIKFRNKESYGMKYCAGRAVKNEWNGKVFGYDYSGCNDVEFKALMKTVKSKDAFDTEGFMLRLDKKILNLPPLTEEIVILGEDMPRELNSMDAQMMRQYSPEDVIKQTIAINMGKKGSDELHLMTYRRMLGQYKVKAAVSYIESILDETEDKLVLVGVHIDVIQEIEKRLSDYSPLIISSKMSNEKRFAMVKEFQTNKKRRIIGGNMDVIGIGYTMTEADRIILIEYGWAPGQNRQVIDRGHRYGLDHPLLAQYLCFRNSLDRSTLETLMRKERITSYV